LLSGQFIAGELSTHEQVTQLFTNFTWTKDDLTVEQSAIVANWKTPYTYVFVNLVIYILFTVSMLIKIFLENMKLNW
jgi:chloride channel 2